MARWLPPCRRAALAAAAVASLAAAPASKPPSSIDGGWPRDVTTDAGSVTLYQPQLESWDGHRLAVYAAIALKDRPDSAPVFGVAWADGPTVVDRDARLVTFFDPQVRRVSLPSSRA